MIFLSSVHSPTALYRFSLCPSANNCRRIRIPSAAQHSKTKSPFLCRVVRYFTVSFFFEVLHRNITKHKIICVCKLAVAKKAKENQRKIKQKKSTNKAIKTTEVKVSICLKEEKKSIESALHLAFVWKKQYTKIKSFEWSLRQRKSEV